MSLDDLLAPIGYDECYTWKEQKSGLWSEVVCLVVWVLLYLVLAILDFYRGICGKIFRKAGSKRP